jgi:hypothetical protein
MQSAGCDEAEAPGDHQAPQGPADRHLQVDARARARAPVTQNVDRGTHPNASRSPWPVACLVSRVSGALHADAGARPCGAAARRGLAAAAPRPRRSRAAAPRHARAPRCVAACAAAHCAHTPSRSLRRSRRAPWRREGAFCRSACAAAGVGRAAAVHRRARAVGARNRVAARLQAAPAVAHPELVRLSSHVNACAA